MDIAREIRIAAPPSTVWEAWTTRADGWFPDRIEGEAVAGGTVTWMFDDFGAALVQQVDVADRDRRLVLSMETRGLPRRVTEVTLEPDGDGTRLALGQSGLPDHEIEGCDRGWVFALEILRLYVERHFGRPRGTVMTMHPANYTTASLAPLYGTSEGLARWLTTAGGLDEGLTLRDGGTMSAKVIERMLPEILVTWDEIGGVFNFKAFETGPSKRMIGFFVTGWDFPQDSVARVRTELEQATKRLVPLLDG